MAMEEAKKQALKEGVRAAITPLGFVRGMTKTLDRLGKNSLTRAADRVLSKPADAEDRLWKGVGSVAGRAATAIRGALKNLPTPSGPGRGRRQLPGGKKHHIYPNPNLPIKKRTTPNGGSTDTFLKRGVGL